MLTNIFNKNIKKDKGFTIIELLVTMAIFTLILGAITLFARDIFYYNNIFSGGLTSYDQARKILQPISSEIRSASSSSLGSYPIEKTGDIEFIFFSDVNNDGLKERIRYFLSDTDLKRGVIIPSGTPLQYLTSNEKISIIIQGIRNGATPIFTYFDTNYNGSTAPLSQPVMIIKVRLVKITLVIDADPNRPPSAVTVTTQVSMRNLKDNL
jgi:prepilin-type N-terminal cleavage/methylation domain-containing protein